MLAVELAGGLGNQLFQLAAADTIARDTHRMLCIKDNTSPKTVHTDANYFTSVFSAWNALQRIQTPYTTLSERSYAKGDWGPLPIGNVCLTGYFQNWQYVSDEFLERIRIPSSPPLNGAFLHIRGGDYVNNPFHDVGLYARYYTSAVQEFPAGTHFYVFTNDIQYAKCHRVLDDISCTIVEADEISSLSQMAACTLGGICANSSFSWWGAFLNRNRTIVMPNKWFNGGGIYTQGYYFPGVRVCSV